MHDFFHCYISPYFTFSFPCIEGAVKYTASPIIYLCVCVCVCLNNKLCGLVASAGVLCRFEAFSSDMLLFNEEYSCVHLNENTLKIISNNFTKRLLNVS